MSTAPGTDMVVVNRWTGEQVDVAQAETDDLAAFHAAGEHALGEMQDMLAEVNRELVRRLDRRARGTMRVGDPKVRQFELTVPSATAGTETYPEPRLEVELAGLARRGVIDVEAAADALVRQLVVAFDVPIDARLTLEALRELAQRELAIEVGGVNVRVAKVDIVRRSVRAGIDRMRKVKGTRAALDRALERKPTPDRRVKVKPIRQER